jgi:hypothetical protein
MQWNLKRPPSSNSVRWHGEPKRFHPVSDSSGYGVCCEAVEFSNSRPMSCERTACRCPAAPWGKQQFKVQSAYATASFSGAAVGCFASLFPRKLTNSEFTSTAWVQVMQCGPSFTTTRRDPLISLAVRSPEAVIGRIRSASPCMTRVGTSMRVRSLVSGSRSLRIAQVFSSGFPPFAKVTKRMEA